MSETTTPVKTKIDIVCPKSEKHVNWFITVQGDGNKALKDFTARLKKGECIVCGEPLILKQSEQKIHIQPVTGTLSVSKALNTLDYKKLQEYCVEKGDSDNLAKIQLIEQFIKKDAHILAKQLLGRMLG